MKNQATDVICPFLIDAGLSRGQAVRLTDVLDTIIDQHAYPEPIGRFISESVVLTSLLSSTIKYEGTFTLQIQSSGAISALIVSMTNDGRIRAYARFDEKELQSACDKEAKEGLSPVAAFFKEGRLSFMVEQGDQTYQGIVALEKRTLTDCVMNYFDQSEQIPTVIKLSIATPRETGSGWTAAAVMLQRMPMDRRLAQTLKEEEIDELWSTALILLKSLTDKELTDRNLELEKLLYRLYHLNDLHFFIPKKIEFGCRCSQEKVIEMLRRFPKKDRMDMVVDGQIKVNCQFCGKNYTLTLKDLDSGE